MIKGPIHKKLRILNIYALIDRASKYMNQKLIELKGEIDKSIMIIGDFNTPLSIIDRPIEQLQ